MFGTWLPRPTSPQLKLGQLAELSQLADGTLDPARATDVGARITASAELAELYERERRAVIAVHEARATGRAPAALRARIAAQRKLARAHKRRRGRYAVSLAAALLATVLLTAPSGIPGAPSVSQAAALGLRGPQATAPTPDPEAPAGRLSRSLDDVYFPNWWARFGWRAIGQREDRIDGRRALTVYYATGRGAAGVHDRLGTRSLGAAPPPWRKSTGSSCGRLRSAGGRS